MIFTKIWTNVNLKKPKFWQILTLKNQYFDKIWPKKTFFIMIESQ